MKIVPPRAHRAAAIAAALLPLAAQPAHAFIFQPPLSLKRGNDQLCLRRASYLQSRAARPPLARLRVCCALWSGPGGTGFDLYSLLSAFGGWVAITAKVLAVPYLAVVGLLWSAQRTIIYPRPAVFADPAVTGGKLVLLAASDPLIQCSSAADGPASASGASPTVAAVYFPAKDSMPTIVYFHGNADQVGWGASYIGKELSERFGFGFYGIEYPGYGASQGLAPTEAALYLASQQLLDHLASPQGLNVDSGKTILLGQSIGCAVVVEMASRGYGTRMILLSPFTSIRQMASAAFPVVAPALAVLPWLVRDKFDNESKASKLLLPALVLHGTQDEIVPYSQGRRLAATLPNCRFEDLEGAGHNDLFGAEHEETVLWHIQRFAGME